MEQPIVESERIILVLPHADHLPAYVRYCASERSVFVGGPFDPAKAFEKLCAMSGHWGMRGFGRFVMVSKATGQPIGHVGALQLDRAERPEMTWTLWDGAFEGKGYAFEAARAYLSHASDTLDFESLLIRIEKHNHRSLRLAERIGTTRDDAAKPPTWTPDAVTYVVNL